MDTQNECCKEPVDKNARVYGLICEHKLDAALIWEMRPLTYNEAQNRMREYAARAHIIRVAIFQMKFIDGNKNLIEKE